MQNIFILVGGAIAVVLLWLILGRNYLHHTRRQVQEKWEHLFLQLQKRQDLVPNLIETVRNYDQNQEGMVQELIGVRTKAAHLSLPDAIKVEAEHDLSGGISRMIDLGRLIAELSKDTNFLELRTEFRQLTREIESSTQEYNELVREYNRNRTRLFLRPLAVIFGLSDANIFEFEARF